MKSKKTFHYCEYCNRPIEDVSPPSKKQYEQGVVRIGDYSDVLLSKELVKKNHRKGYSDSHCKSLEGYYCNYLCLHEHLREILKLKAI